MNSGAFGENFPYSNFHDLNTDWIIKIAKDFLDQYTHIQETIQNGLDALDNKATKLQALLDAWYETHSTDIANQLASALADLNEWYAQHQNYLNNTLAENIELFDSHADAKAEETIKSIPTDYTSLFNQVQSLNNIETTMVRKTGASYLIEDDNPIVANKPIYLRGVRLIPEANFHADIYGITAGSSPVIIYDDLPFDGTVATIIPPANYDHINIVLKGTGSENCRPVCDIDTTQNGLFLSTDDGREYLENINDGVAQYYKSYLPIYSIMKAVPADSEITFTMLHNDRGSYTEHLSLAIYGVTGNRLNDGYDTLAIIEKGTSTFKTTKNYNHLAVGVFPYISMSSYNGYFDFLLSFTNHGVSHDINEINKIIDNNEQYVYSNGRSLDSPFNIEVGDVVSFTLTTDGVTPDVFLFTGDAQSEGFAQIISGLPYNTEVIMKFDTAYRKIHFYNGNNATEYAVKMKKLYKEPDTYKFSYNKSVYQIFIPHESGDTVFFRIKDCAENVKFNLYGMYGRTIGDGYDTIIADANIGALYRKTLTRQYHHLQTAVSPYSSSFSSTYNGEITLNDKSLLNDVYNLQNGTKPKYFYNQSTFRIFKKVTCIGDSYTSGYIYNGSTEYGENEQFAYPHFMETASGNTYINCGVSGANAKTWQSSLRGLPKMLSNGRSQAYIIGLMINDQSDSERHLDLGTPSDIGTHNNTYYAGISEIITQIKNQNPTAKIFLNTCPKDGENYPEYNTAIRTIASHYSGQNVYCIDLADTYKTLYTNQSLITDYFHGHYTALGYEQFAEIYQNILSDYINNHVSEFQDVFLIPYDA